MALVGLDAELHKDRGQEAAEVALRRVFGIEIKKSNQSVPVAFSVLDDRRAC